MKIGTRYLKFEFGDEGGPYIMLTETLEMTFEAGQVVIRNAESGITAWEGRGDFSVEAIAEYLKHRLGML